METIIEEKDRIEALDPADIRETYRSWYPLKAYKTKSGIGFQTVGLITGCGILQGYGVSMFIGNDSRAKEFVDEIIPQMEADLQEKVENIYNPGTRKAGTVLVTLGQDFYRNEHRLLDMGFVPLTEYPNYQHGMDGHYKQKLYVLNLKLKKP